MLCNQGRNCNGEIGCVHYIQYPVSDEYKCWARSYESAGRNISLCLCYVDSFTIFKSIVTVAPRDKACTHVHLLTLRHLQLLLHLKLLLHLYVLCLWGPPYICVSK